jgi:hypothetical protein
LQEREEERMMTATSGMKLLGLLGSANRGGLLEKMLKELLTSKEVWFSDKCKMIWKKRVSKSNVLLFQLQASVRGIKGKEYGSLPTPTAMDYIDRKTMRPSRAATNRKSGYLSEMIKMYPTPTQDAASERTKKYKQGGTPLTMAVKMYPTPNATNINTPQPDRVEQTNSGGFILRKKNKPHMTYGARLQDAMLYMEKMYPTPTEVLKNNTHGGKLNPHFVEFLMAYPMNWTKVEPTE